ncbi:MAG: hypothetical protein ACI9U1_001652, partial [Porticoccaceae bacterium]
KIGRAFSRLYWSADRSNIILKKIYKAINKTNIH